MLLPSPFRTFKSLLALLGTWDFYRATLSTIGRIMGGFLLGMLLGTALGALTASSRWLDAFFSPIRNIVKSTPVASFSILVLLWIATDLAPMGISMLMVMPIAWSNVHEGIRAVDRNLLEMAEVFRLSRGKRLRHIYAPSILPQYLAACSTGLGIAWKSGVAAEVIALPSLSIGKSLYLSKIYIETADLFAWTVVVILLSLLIERLLVSVLRRVQRW